MQNFTEYGVVDILEGDILSVIENLNNLLMEMDDMTYHERKEVKGTLEQLLMEIQKDSILSELSGEQRLLLARGLCELAAIYRGEIGYTTSDGERAWNLYIKAKGIYDEELGKGNSDSWRVSTYTHGLGHELLGDSLLLMAKKKKAFREYHIACQIYNAIRVRNIKNNNDSYRWETDKCEAGIERILYKQQNTG